MKARQAIVIAVTNQKGGVGKSTMALHIAAEFSLQGFKTKLIDTDPQGSVLDWTVQRDAEEHESIFEVEAWPKDTLHKHMKSKSEGFDVVVIDVPPQVESHCRSAVIASDLVLIPLNASPLDIWAAASTVDVVEAARQFKPELKAAFLLNGIDSRTILSRRINEALEEHEEIDVLPSKVCSRVNFSYAISAGQVIQEYKPNSKGAIEIKKVVDNIKAYFE